MNLAKSDIDKIVVIGDRLLLKPTSFESRTKSGLLLPPGIEEKENLLSGYVIKVGPGYPIPNLEVDEPWKPASDSIKYIPLQVEIGDLAIFLQKHAYEIQFNGQKYFILAQSSVLMVVRDDFEQGI
ncbi:MAG: co-chaperone GroES [Chitinophagales bacterium]